MKAITAILLAICLAQGSELLIAAPQPSGEDQQDSAKVRDERPDVYRRTWDKYRRMDSRPRESVVSGDQLLKMRAPGLSKALEDPESLWLFITAPGTSYLQRLAAALQGRDTFPVERIPRLMAAIGELRRESKLHYWGLEPRYQSAINMYWRELPSLKNVVPKQRERTVLGKRWTIPTSELPFPYTIEEKERAPWPRFPPEMFFFQ